MNPIQIFEGLVAPLPTVNVDTDQIIPARYLKGTDRSGLGEGLFSGWRYLPNGEEDSSFVLNQPRYLGAEILLAGDNFGCGSSREHAPWALLACGFRAVLSTRFADIFRNNSLGNGLLPVTLPKDVWNDLIARATMPEPLHIKVDLGEQKIFWGEGRSQEFQIDPFARRCLLRGEDRFDYLLSQIPAAESFESAREAPVRTPFVTQDLSPHSPVGQGPTPRSTP